ncbi:hypothetical protein M438DRAFT_338599 [Aureobasidium pullulans EXF-150]|uniref:Uncharacterized protein n=1 Tax=Aureobasidium pullulans EXF-150 TaxID=1043002 RepID=A0A074Y169_AURPU|nr:uncharacterized protein M438DRAFT_338599 [Aureobasidium pullulans EXF-150]KEQ80621.1 hypothetical protein M438DRAFT_338599 [Aureobasidium pullulans EXF-150]
MTRTRRASTTSVTTTSTWHDTPSNPMRTHTNLERGDIKVLLRCVLVVRSSGGLAPKQQAELEAAATLHLETIKTELGISDDVHVVYLKSRQSNIALPNVGHERQFGLKSLGEALVATQGTHLNVVALSYTGLTTDIGSLRSWCSQVAKQVESFSISEGITSSATTFCMSTEGKEQRKGAEMS